jgi:proteasome activator subunit 3 (PA28 gamma)
VYANKHLQKVHDVVKKQCEELATSCVSIKPSNEVFIFNHAEKQYQDKVKLWINLSMPRIEDGDNFGVQVQEGSEYPTSMLEHH